VSSEEFILNKELQMNTKKLTLYKKLMKTAYLMGVIFLLVGMMLSMVNRPALALSDKSSISINGKPGTVLEKKDKTPDPSETADPTEDQNQGDPTEEVTDPPAGDPTEEVTADPTEEVTADPTEEVTQDPTEDVTQDPTEELTLDPTEDITDQPTEDVTEAPTVEVTETEKPPKEHGNETGSSLSFTAGCSGTCDSITATIKNTGSGDMVSSSTYDVYFSTSGWSSAVLVPGAGGTFGPLDAGESEVLSASADMGSGTYWIVANQEAGHPGTGETRSGGCEIICTVATTPPPPPSTPTPISPLDLSYACLENGDGIEWTVSNPNAFAVNFNWAVDSSTGSDTAPSGGSVTFTTSSGGAHSGSISWDGGSDSSNSSSDECLLSTQTPPPPNGTQDLTLAYLCLGLNEGIQWTINNPNDFAVDFDWSLDGGAQTGSGTVPANGSLVVVVSAIGSHSLSVSWMFPNEDEGSTSLENGENFCRQTPPPPPQGTPDPDGTLPPPEFVTVGTPVVLIPVTGVDNSAPFGLDMLQKLLINLGLAFFGIGLVFSGITRKFIQ
jgi:hypothetical protein